MTSLRRQALVPVRRWRPVWVLGIGLGCLLAVAAWPTEEKEPEPTHCWAPITPELAQRSRLMRAQEALVEALAAETNPEAISHLQDALRANHAAALLSDASALVEARDRRR